MGGMWACLPGEAALTRIPDLLTRRFFSPAHPTGTFQVPIAFHKMVTGEGSGGDLGKLEAFAGVGEFPVRVKCATLAWHRLRAAIQGKQDTVSTEE